MFFSSILNITSSNSIACVKVSNGTCLVLFSYLDRVFCLIFSLSASSCWVKPFFFLRKLINSPGFVLNRRVVKMKYCTFDESLSESSNIPPIFEPYDEEKQKRLDELNTKIIENIRYK